MIWFSCDAVNSKILKIKPCLKRVRVLKTVLCCRSYILDGFHIEPFQLRIQLKSQSERESVKVLLHCGNEYSDKRTKRFFKSNKVGFIVLGRDTNGICSLIDVLLESLFTASLIVFRISY